MPKCPDPGVRKKRRKACAGDATKKAAGRKTTSEQEKTSAVRRSTQARFYEGTKQRMQRTKSKKERVVAAGVWEKRGVRETRRGACRSMRQAALPGVAGEEKDMRHGFDRQRKQ